MFKKTKILAYLDSPTCATGFATVSRNALMGLFNTGRYDIEILGINYFGDPHSFPFRIWPVAIGSPDGDPYGRKKIFNMILQMDFDILFFLQDTFILNFLPELIPLLKSRGKKFKSVVYYPIDGTPKKEWLDNIKVCDEVVAYTEFGKNLTEQVQPELTGRVKIIPHGVNTNEFFPINDKEKLLHFRKHFFGTNADKFIFTNVSRNQRRKDIPRNLMAFKEFKKEVPNSLMYLHMARKDQGWDIDQLCASLELSTKSDVVLPENFGPNQGFPREVVNFIYNASDCVVSTTHGEGWGLCLHPNTNVYTDTGVKEIKNITIEDKVLSSDGTFNTVEAVMSKAHDGLLYNIHTRASNIPIKSSPEHGFKVYDLSTGAFTWKKAEELCVGDHLVFPKNSNCVSTKTAILALINRILNEHGQDKATQTKDYLLFPINKITTENYCGKLVDIQVAITNDFVAENVVVHNSWIEAMASKTSVLMPNNTAMTEFITEDRGYLMKSGGDLNLYTVLNLDNEVVRPVVDVKDMVSKMLHIYNNQEEALQKATNAYNWVVTEMDWQRNVVPMWVGLFDNLVKDLQLNQNGNISTNRVINTELF